MSRKWRHDYWPIIKVLISFVAGFSASFLLLDLDPTVKELGEKQEEFVVNHLAGRHYFAICIIFTSAKNSARRNCIRDTWLRFGEDLQFKHYFVLGTEHLTEHVQHDLMVENQKHEDLLLLSELTDSYHNLSLKLVQTFKWIDRKHRAKFQFLIKVDDDSFVRIDSLFEYLVALYEQRSKHRPIYLGYFDGRAHVKQKGIWKETDWFLCDRYLPYALGGGYVISNQLIKYVAQNSDLLKLYKSEDVSLGTWLAPLAIDRIHEIRFDTEYKSRGCHNSYLIQHKQSINQMITKYNSLRNLQKLCPNDAEFENRLVYEYNWNVLPSRCCVRNKTMMMIK